MNYTFYFAKKAKFLSKLINYNLKECIFIYYLRRIMNYNSSTVVEKKYIFKINECFRIKSTNLYVIGEERCLKI